MFFPSPFAIVTQFSPLVPVMRLLCAVHNFLMESRYQLLSHQEEGLGRASVFFFFIAHNCIISHGERNVKVFTRRKKEQGILENPTALFIKKKILPTKWWRKYLLLPVASVAVASVNLFHIFSGWQQEQIVCYFLSSFFCYYLGFLQHSILTDWL